MFNFWQSFERRRMMQKLWERLKSGLLVPAGHVSSAHQKDTESYLAIKEKAIHLESLYDQHKITIPTRSGLGLLIQSAKTLSDEWFINQAINIDDVTFLRAAHLNRVSESILSIRNDKNIDEHLRRLTDGTLDLNNRKMSPAKNFLWELELLQNLRRHNVPSELKEPPDIIAMPGQQEIGISCKKIYSEKNIEKVISTAVRQLYKGAEHGIVALNIDDLSPPNPLLRAKTIQAASQHLSKINLEFMKRNERLIRKYLEPGRALCFIVSTGMIGRVESTQSTNNFRQSTGWSLIQPSNEHKHAFDDLVSAITSN